MLEQCKNAAERWGGVSKIIDTWLDGRKQLLVRYYQIAELDSSLNDAVIDEKLKLFCQLLMDYTSAGHFEVFEQLVDEARAFNDSTSLKFADRIYPKIQETTEVILDFNERFDRCGAQGKISELQSALCTLGEKLEHRFQQEDQLIQCLHTAHAKAASASPAN